ncbi:SGS-domain-containing protein [Macroventuria anomochaeta]|uniref:SGS-domain-containing protein n=1 Tax=Macroventuria anomochaeta TaxID=301207 RepID=A0ACB6RXG9_9PLEO|nr:SGS-domain-containing protein [Macroventuria anomochaeta]KAF2626670.1 SGS-domain-containing protein [Macroventuria anomochaeta]
MDAARKGEAALSASNYDEAIQHFTDALKSNPGAVKYYINRCTAYQRIKKYTEALADAEIAVVLAHKRATRELIKDAQFRRAQQLWFLERYADAEYVLRIVKKLDEKEKTLPIWELKVAKKLQDMPEGDEKRKVTVKDVPDVEVTSASQETSTTKKTEAPAAAPKPVVPTPANKIKDDWYQSTDTVTVNILAKGAPKDKVTVDFDKDSFSVSFPVEGSDAEYNFNIDPLYAPIDPTESRFRVTPNKVEVTLKKASPGAKWKTLEGDRQVEAAEGSTSTIPQHILSGKPAQDSAPAYPTSSKSGAKNWDKLAAEDLDDKDEIEGDETSHFFKKLYGGATPDQQRAMMKSYQESGGTVLSTDWSNVGGKTVVPEPPEGMEAKKY